MNPPYRVRNHPLVAWDLDAIFDWIADFAGEDIAERKIGALIDSRASLAERPHQGTRRDEILPKLRAIPSAGKSVIAFEVDDKRREVYILAITYGGADWIGRVRSRAET